MVVTNKQMRERMRAGETILDVLLTLPTLPDMGLDIKSVSEPYQDGVRKNGEPLIVRDIEVKRLCCGKSDTMKVSSIWYKLKNKSCRCIQCSRNNRRDKNSYQESAQLRAHINLMRLWPVSQTVANEPLPL